MVNYSTENLPRQGRFFYAFFIHYLYFIYTLSRHKLRRDSWCFFCK